MTAAARKDLDRRQRRWADEAGVGYDRAGFVRELDANLARPLDAAMRRELERGSELAPRGSRPARIHSVSSSAALVVNVFGPWRETDTKPLAAALGFDGAPAVAFEEPVPTGLEGEPPLIDVLLRWPSGRVAAVESKFGEWLVRRPRNKAAFKPKYFPVGEDLWARAGLVACQALAADIQALRERFRWLHAAQLLKHALALSRSAEAGYALVYVYYAWPGREGPAHRAEIERFQARVASELDFRALTYQDLFRALAADSSSASIEYLRGRYFRDG
jgi:Restriction Endonuclease associating with ARP